MNGVRNGPGRPPKYGRQSRAIALTLPEDIIEELATIDADLGRAVVSVVERRRSRAPRRSQPAELSSYGSHAVIVVMPIRALKRLKGVQLVPIGNGRALISLEQPHAIAKLELEIRDAMDHHDVAPDERQTLRAIGDILRQARSSKNVAIEERTIIVLESRRRRRPVPPRSAG